MSLEHVLGREHGPLAEILSARFDEGKAPFGVAGSVVSRRPRPRRRRVRTQEHPVNLVHGFQIGKMIGHGNAEATE